MNDTGELLLEGRFWAKVDTSGGPDACWPWTAYKNAQGYGVVTAGRKGATMKAHQMAYQLTRGPIPVGESGKKLPIDHTCHNEAAARGECHGGSTCPHRRCQNPKHLVLSSDKANALASPLTLASHNASRTHCPNGHPYSEENTVLYGKGFRRCRICRRDQARSAQRRHRAKRRSLTS